MRRLCAIGVLCAVAATTAARADGCGGEPQGSNSKPMQVWWQEYRNWCSCKGGSMSGDYNTAVAEGGCRLPEGSGSSPGSTPSGDSAGTVIGTAIGKAIADSLFPSTEELARRRAIAGQAAAAAESERLERLADDRNRSARLLNAMLDTNPDVQAQQLDTASNRDDGMLGLMLGDEPIPRTGSTTGEGIMPTRNTAPPIRTGPRAVIKQPEAPGPQQNLLEQMMQDPAPVAAAPEVPAVPAVPAPPQGPRIDGFTRGFEHGSGCYSQNAGPACSGADPAVFDACLDDYRRGYSAGERAKNLDLDTAYRAGRDAKAAHALNDGASQAIAVGTCRIEMIKAYNSGYAGAPHP